MTELYISVDIEADGPIPGENSMLSLGAVAITRDGEVKSEWYRKMYPIPGASQDPVTMREFWANQPEAWAEVNSNRSDVLTAMNSYKQWLDQLGMQYKCIHAAYPAGFDFTFIRYYMCKFVTPKWDFSCLDMKSFAMVVMNCDYSAVFKGSMPKKWFVENKFPHNALEDARNQAYMLVEMFKDLE
jgi:DNA polymerase III alpha subunit (gram-positive type)